MNRAVLVLGVCLCVVSTEFSFAQCPDPNNVVVNCGFESDLSNWIPRSGVYSITTSDSRSGAACVEVDSFYNPTYETYQFQLEQNGIPISGDTTYTLGGYFKRVSGDLTNSCRIAWVEYEVCPMTNFVGGTPTGWISPNSTGWTLASKVFTTHPDAACGRLLLECLDAPVDFIARVDDVYLIATLIFVDGFESDDTSAWSGTP